MRVFVIVVAYFIGVVGSFYLGGKVVEVRQSFGTGDEVFGASVVAGIVFVLGFALGFFGNFLIIDKQRSDIEKLKEDGLDGKK